MRPRMLAGSLAEAVELASSLKSRGAFDWFRGQPYDWRPLRTTGGRQSAEGRGVAMQRLQRFQDWATNLPELSGLADGDEEAVLDSVFAIAQHYGIPTPFLDFTADPAIAGFFAAQSGRVAAEQKFGCIICLNSADLREFWTGLSAAKPEWPEPRLVKVGIPELWRIHAQSGAFLFLPYDDFEKIYDFDRIYFPANGDMSLPIYHAVLPKYEDVYPRQQSDLEIQLDRFFMLEKMGEGDAALAASPDFTRVAFSGPSIETECFGAAGLPVHDSWNEPNLMAWMSPAAEAWSKVTNAPEIETEAPDLREPAKSIAKLAKWFESAMHASADLRRGPVVWKVGHSKRVAESLELYWNGGRRWPYPAADLAYGLAFTAVLATMVDLAPSAVHDPRLAERQIGLCMGPLIEIEIGMGDGSYTRGYAGIGALQRSVRIDFASYLNANWKTRISGIHSVLQIAKDPTRVFVFSMLAEVFARQFTPSQVVLRGTGTGKARIYNPAYMQLLGLP